MKKVLILILFLIFIDSVGAGKVIVSKKDIETGEYITDCDFVIFNDSGNIVDSWIQNSSYHFSNLDNGTYKLVSRPYVMGVFNDEMSSSYMLNVSDNILKFTIYNQKIDTPDNLSSNNYFIFGFLFIFLGGFFCCKYYFL